MTDPRAVLREIEELSKTTFLPIIGSKKGRYLVDAIRRSGAARVLEVGTLIGYSSILIASNLPDNGKVVTIEINQDSADIAEMNLRKAGLADMVEIRLGDALKLIPDIDGMFDMVFLDATKNEYHKYLELSEDKLKKDGIVFADNVKMAAREMKSFLEYVRDSGRYRSEYIDVGFDGVEISVKLF
jgi:predicted O-methyltransferase YrrM